MKFIKSTNDILALLLLVIVIPGLWVGQALGALALSGQVEGALIMGWTIVIQYYFRKKASETH